MLGSLVPPARRVGPAVIGGLVAALAAVWLVVGPADGDWGSFVGQLCGALAILLMSAALVLISTLPWVETWFDGIDRAAVWHRRLAMSGLVLLVPHVMLSNSRHQSGWGSVLAVTGTIGLVSLVVWAVLPRWRDVLPRPLRPRATELGTWLVGIPWLRRLIGLGQWLLGDYERWRSLHRLTGLFVAMAFVHGLADATVFASPLLRWTFVAVGGIGLAFYVYRETVAPYFVPSHDYQVAAVTPITPDLTELALTPLGAPMRFTPGQFAMLFLESKRGWRRHPFTLSSAPGDGTLRFTIKALGDDTRDLSQIVRPGMPAVVGGPHGRFTHAKGTGEQIWIAGGIGVTPFLSWLRAMDQHPVTAQIDFYYSHAGPTPFAHEIAEIAARHDNLRVHLVDTTVDGYLTPRGVLDAHAGDTADLSVFLCGPAAMVTTFTRGFRRAGVRPRNLHREHFDWR